MPTRREPALVAFVDAVLTHRVAHRFAMEFPTPEAREKYLKEHPDADKSKHTVKKAPPAQLEGKTPEAQRAVRLLGKGEEFLKRKHLSDEDRQYAKEYQKEIWDAMADKDKSKLVDLMSQYDDFMKAVDGERRDEIMENVENRQKKNKGESKTAASVNVKAPMSHVAKAKELLADLEKALKAFQDEPSAKTAKALAAANGKVEDHMANKLGQAMAKLLDESDGRQAW